MNTQLIQSLNRTYPVEALRIVSLIREYQVTKENRLQPTARNLVDTCRRNIAETALRKYATCAIKRKLIVEKSSFKDKPTYELTLKGLELAKQLEAAEYRV